MIDWIKNNRDAIVTVIACLGFGLGVFNLWREHRKTKRAERVRIVVVPKLYYTLPGGMIGTAANIPDPRAFIAIEIINHSHFPVFIDSIGIFAPGFEHSEGVLVDPLTLPQKQPPYRLERNESVLAYSPKMGLKQLVGVGVSGAWVNTTTGERFSGTSDAIKAVFSRYQEQPKLADGRVDWERVNSIEI